jgi:hypothetical protein
MAEENWERCGCGRFWCFDAVMLCVTVNLSREMQLCARMPM